MNKIIKLILLICVASLVTLFICWFCFSWCTAGPGDRISLCFLAGFIATTGTVFINMLPKIFNVDDRDRPML